MLSEGDDPDTAPEELERARPVAVGHSKDVGKCKLLVE